MKYRGSTFLMFKGILNMFNAILKLSYWITDKISSSDDEDKDYYQYAIHGILSFLFSTSFAIVLSVIFNYSYYLILIIPSVLFLRSKSGGSHANTPQICFLWTNLMYFIIGIISLYSSYLFDSSCIVLFIVSLCYGLTGLKQVPRYTLTATRHSDKKQKTFKKQYIIRLMLFYILIFIGLLVTNISKYNFSIISNILSMSIIVNRFSLSNSSFWILSKLK